MVGSWKKNKAGFSEEAFSWKIIPDLRLQSKLVLTTTGILLLGGTICILLFEYKNPDTLGSLSFGQKLMAAAFSVCDHKNCRFFTVAQGALTSGSVMICLFLMLVGGSPMGTAGGVKTTTLAVLVMSYIAKPSGKKGCRGLWEKDSQQLYPFCAGSCGNGG